MMPFCRHPSANSAMCVLQIGNDTAGSSVVVYLCRCKGYVAQQDCEDQGCHQLCRAPSCCCMTNSGYHAHLGIRLFVQTLTSHGVSVAIVRCHGHLLRSLPLSAMACRQIESAKADWTIRYVSMLQKLCWHHHFHCFPLSLVLLVQDSRAAVH